MVLCILRCPPLCLCPLTSILLASWNVLCSDNPFVHSLVKDSERNFEIDRGGIWEKPQHIRYGSRLTSLIMQD